MNTPLVRRIRGVFVAFGALAAVSLQAATTLVTFQNFTFTPKAITIRVGDTVTWTNAGGIHTVTGDGADPFCGTANVPIACSHTFTAVGTFPYHCVPHQAFGMVGSVTVLETSNAAPTITLATPGNGAVYAPPADVTLTATVSDSDGKVAQVVFYLGTEIVGTLTNAPYRLTLTHLSPGNYTATAKVTDDLKAETTSAAAAFTVAPHALYQQVNLVSDIPNLALHTDTNLLNPWAIATSPTGPFWIADNHTGLSTLYNTAGDLQALVVTIPSPTGGTPPSAPTGMVFNNTPDFNVSAGAPALFVFSTEGGTIAAWNAGTSAVLKVDSSASGAIYKGLASGAHDGKNYLYATDFHNSKVDVFDANFAPVTLGGAFADPSLPVGFAPFGVQNVGGNLFVTYARQDANGEDDVPSPGSGFVNVFGTDGVLQRRFASKGALDSPWGVAVAPDGFGQLSRALLIGNFGDGVINAFDPDTGVWLNSINDASGKPIQIVGLWGLKFGNGGRGGVSSTLYFAAGIAGSGRIEDHGLFGSINPLAPLQITATSSSAARLDLSWLGGSGPFLLQRKLQVTNATWTDVITTSDTTASISLDGAAGFIRVVDNATSAALR